MKRNWVNRPFEDVLQIINGRNQKEVESPKGKYPIFGSAGTPMGMAKEYLCPAGSTIIGRKGTIDRPIFSETPFWNVDTAFGLSPGNDLDPRFLFYFCESYNFKRHNKGTTLPSLVKTDLLRIEMPCPPMQEQKHIVAKLDEVFAGLAKAKENAEKNLQNARALFESHLESVFNQRRPGWAEKPLGKVCDLQNGYAFKSGDYINASNTLNIRMSNIRPGGSFDPEHNQRFLPDSYARKYAAFLLREGDLIIAMTDMAGDPKILGVPTLVGNLDGRNFLMNQRVGKLFGFSADVRPPYLRYFLTSPLVKQFYKSKGAGGLQINISKGDILSVKIPLPDVTNQDLVVKQLDALTEETQRLARLYEQKLEALESFKKSILHEAFTGNL